MSKGRFNLLTPEEMNNIVGSLSSPIQKSFVKYDPSEFKRVDPALGITGGIRGLQEARADAQSGLFWKGLGNVAGSAIFEFLKSPGQIAALGSAAVGSDKLLDNWWLQAFDYAQQHTTGDLFEVYKSPSREDQGLWQQLSDPQFWASEGAETLGMMLSFMLPGQILKSVGAGSKLAQLAMRVGKLEDVVVDGSKMIQAGEANMFGKLLARGIGKTGRATDFDRLARTLDSATAVAVNTAFEAGAEASDTYENMLSQGYSKEEAAKAAQGVALMNIGLLTISNTLLEKYVMRGFNRLPVPESAIAKALKGEAVSISAIKQGLGRAAQGFIAEGVIEEGLQASFQEAQGRFIPALQTYINNLGSLFSGEPDKEFGTGVILGGILGSGMGAAGGVAEAREMQGNLYGKEASDPGAFKRLIGFKAREKSEGIIPTFRANFENLKRGKDVLSQIKSADDLKEESIVFALANYHDDLLEKYNGNEKDAQIVLARELHAQGVDVNVARSMAEAFSSPKGLTPKEALKWVEHQRDVMYFSRFASAPGGFDILDKHIEDMSQAVAERYEANTGLKLDENRRRTIETEIKEKAKTFRKIYESVKGFASPQRYNFDIKPEDELEYAKFIDKATNHAVNAAVDSQFFEERMADITDKDSPTYKAYEKAKKELDEEVVKYTSASGLEPLWQKTLEIKKEHEKQKALLHTINGKAIDPDNPDIIIEVREALKAKGYPADTDDTGALQLNAAKTYFKVAGTPYMLRPIKGGIEVVGLDSKKVVGSFTSLQEFIKHFKKVDFITEEEGNKILEQVKEEIKQAKIRNQLLAFRRSIAAVNEAYEQKKIAVEREIAQIQSEINITIDSLTDFIKKEQSEAKVKAEIKRIDAEVARLRKAKDVAEGKLVHIRASQSVLSKMMDEANRVNDKADIQEVLKESDVVSAIEGLVGTDAEMMALIDKFLSTDGPEVVAQLDELAAVYSRLAHAYGDAVNVYENAKTLLEEILTSGQVFKTVPKAPFLTKAFLDKWDINGELKRIIDVNAKGDELLKVAMNVIEYLKRQKPVGYMSDVKEFVEDMKKVYTKADIEGALKLAPAMIDEFRSKGTEVTKKFRALNLIEQLKAKNELEALLKQRYSKILSELDKFLKEPAQALPETDGGEPIDELSTILSEDDRRAKVVTMFNTSSRNIEIDNQGNDIYEPIPGTKLLIPQVTDDPIQRRFFQWLDTNPGDFKVLAYAPKWDGKDFDDITDDKKLADKLRKFIAQTPKSAQENAIYTVVVTGEGVNMKIAMYKGEPLITSMMLSETKFPEGKKPRMADDAVLSEFLFSVSGGKSRISINKDSTGKVKFSKTEKEALKKVIPDIDFDTKANILYRKLLPYAYAWAKEEYTRITQNLVKRSQNESGEKLSNRTTWLEVSGISAGHPVQARDSDNKIVRFPISEAVSLQLDSAGQPVNFTLHKVDFKGEIVINNKRYGGYSPGRLYANVVGKGLVLIEPELISDEEVELIIHLISMFEGGRDLSMSLPNSDPNFFFILNEGKVTLDNIPILPTKGQKFSVMSLLINWGFRGNSEKTTPYDIYISHGDLVFGDQTMSVADIAKAYKAKDKEALKPLTDFLKNKRLNVNYRMLESKGKFFKPVLRKGKVEFHMEKESYIQFLLNRSMTTAVPDNMRGELPMFAQKMLQFRNPEKYNQPTAALASKIAAIPDAEVKGTAVTTVKSTTTQKGGTPAKFSTEQEQLREKLNVVIGMLSNILSTPISKQKEGLTEKPHLDNLSATFQSIATKVFETEESKKLANRFEELARTLEGKSNLSDAEAAEPLRIINSMRDMAQKHLDDMVPAIAAVPAPEATKSPEIKALAAPKVEPPDDKVKAILIGLSTASTVDQAMASITDATKTKELQPIVLAVTKELKGKSPVEKAKEIVKRYNALLTETALKEGTSVQEDEGSKKRLEHERALIDDLSNALLENEKRPEAYGKGIRVLGSGGFGAPPVYVTKKSSDPKFAQHELEIELWYVVQTVRHNGEHYNYIVGKTYGKNTEEGDYVFFWEDKKSPDGVWNGIPISATVVNRKGREQATEAIVKQWRKIDPDQKVLPNWKIYEMTQYAEERLKEQMSSTPELDAFLSSTGTEGKQERGIGLTDLFDIESGRLGADIIKKDLGKNKTFYVQRSDMTEEQRKTLDASVAILQKEHPEWKVTLSESGTGISIYRTDDIPFKKRSAAEVLDVMIERGLVTKTDC